jgi:hypothetical protein
MAKIGPYPRARRASRLWHNTVIFAFCSGRKGKRPVGTGKLYRTAPFAVSLGSERYQLDLLRGMKKSFLGGGQLSQKTPEQGRSEAPIALMQVGMWEPYELGRNRDPITAAQIASCSESKGQLAIADHGETRAPQRSRRDFPDPDLGTPAPVP